MANASSERRRHWSVVCPREGRGVQGRMNSPELCECVSSTTNTLIELLTCCRLLFGAFRHEASGPQSPSELCWLSSLCVPPLSLSVCVWVCNVCALWKTKANGNALLIRRRNVAGSKRALLIKKKAEWKWLKKREKQKQLATLDSLSPLALCSEARTCPNDAKAYYQKQSRVSPPPPPSSPLPPLALVRIWNGVKNVLTCDDAWKWHAKVFYMVRISFRQQCGKGGGGRGGRGVFGEGRGV